MLVLRGPSKYKKKDKQFYNLKATDIIEAYIDVSGMIFPLEENRLIIERYDTYINIYHTFSYFDEDGHIMWGSWSDDFPLDALRQIKSLFRHKMENCEYEDGEEVPSTAIFRVFFTEKAAEALRGFS
jgi:hypothetical protein